MNMKYCAGWTIFIWFLLVDMVDFLTDFECKLDVNLLLWMDWLIEAGLVVYDDNDYNLYSLMLLVRLFGHSS